ncbi:MAG: iron-sulfur cluster-binding protein [Propionibacteriaceae bacterium]
MSETVGGTEVDDLVVIEQRDRPRRTLARAPVLGHEHVADRYWWLKLHAPQIAAGARPGQFVMLTVARALEYAPVLPRPMALCDWDAETGAIEIVYGVVGEGTRRLSTLAPGEEITTVGPLGRGFTVAEEGWALRPGPIWLIGRGIGTCSLASLAWVGSGIGRDVVAVDSARNHHALISGHCYRSEDLQQLVQVVDSDGSSDPAGLEQRLHALGDQAPPALIATCGSDRLQRLSTRLGRRYGARVEVSLEAHMACGMGYCHGCSRGERTASAEAPLVCEQGPVFQVPIGA